MSQISRRDVITTSAAAALLGGGDLLAQDQDSSPDRPPKRDWWDQEFRTLVTIGESTTAGGWASCRERAWAHQLAREINEFQRVPVELINVGIGANLISTRSPAYPGKSNPAALERLEPHVFRHEPDLLVVSYGFNDARSGTPLDLFIEDLRTLIERVRARQQPLIVLLGPYYMTGFVTHNPKWSKATLPILHQFNEATRQLAGETDCLFVDLLSAYGNADWLIHFDQVHANDVGHRIVANKVFEVLATNCSGLARETKELEQRMPRWRDESVLKSDVE